MSKIAIIPTQLALEHFKNRGLRIVHRDHKIASCCIPAASSDCNDRQTLPGRQTVDLSPRNQTLTEAICKMFD
jgi:hypothetical protein